MTPFLAALIDTLPLWDGDAGTFLSLLVGWRYPFVSWITFVVAGLAVARAGLRRTRRPGRPRGRRCGTHPRRGGARHSHGSRSRMPSRRPCGMPCGPAEPTPAAFSKWSAPGDSRSRSLGVCLLLCRTFAVWIVLPLRAVGSMPLTAYAGQILVWGAVATAVLGAPDRLFAFRDLNPFPAFALGTIAACTVWALAVGRGPLEWLTDVITRFMVPAGEFGRRRRARIGWNDERCEARRHQRGRTVGRAIRLRAVSRTRGAESLDPLRLEPRALRHRGLPRPREGARRCRLPHRRRRAGDARGSRHADARHPGRHSASGRRR